LKSQNRVMPKPEKLSPAEMRSLSARRAVASSVNPVRSHFAEQWPEYKREEKNWKKENFNGLPPWVKNELLVGQPQPDLPT